MSVRTAEDQVVVHEGRIREKPASEADCRAYLKSYEIQPAQTVTSVVVTNTATGKQVIATDIATQHFYPIPDHVVTAVLAKGDIMHCCGGFMVDEPLFAPYLGARIGTEDSITGLPVELTKRLLREAQEP